MLEKSIERSRERKRRIEMVASAIKRVNGLNKVVFEEKLLQEIVKKFDVSSRTAKEYLKELELREIIIRYRGEVWFKENWDLLGNIITEGRKFQDIENLEMEGERERRLKKDE